jgi:hypothetical protein
VRVQTPNSNTLQKLLYFVRGYLSRTTIPRTDRLALLTQERTRLADELDYLEREALFVAARNLLVHGPEYLPPTPSEWSHLVNSTSLNLQCVSYSRPVGLSEIATGSVDQIAWIRIARVLDDELCVTKALVRLVQIVLSSLLKLLCSLTACACVFVAQRQWYLHHSAHPPAVSPASGQACQRVCSLPAVA